MSAVAGIASKVVSKLPLVGKIAKGAWNIGKKVVGGIKSIFTGRKSGGQQPQQQQGQGQSGGGIQGMIDQGRQFMRGVGGMVDSGRQIYQGFRQGGFNGGMNGLNTTAAIDEGMILQGIQGNRSAIDQLASNTNTSFEGVNAGLAQLSVALANNFGDVKTGVAQINSAIATGNQQVISQIYQSITNLQSAMTQQNFDITSAIKDCCCNMREAISGVNANILNQTNVLQNQMSQNAFAMERAFCNQNQLIREESNATRASIDALSKQISQYRYDDLQSENCGLKARLAEANTTNKLNTLQSNILSAIASRPTTTTPAA